MTALGGAEGQLTGALGRLFAVAEAYPDLKANQNMMALQEELSSTENKIAFARQAYNDSVMGYNTQREVFPTSLISGVFNFQEAKLLEIEQPAEREARRCRSRNGLSPERRSIIGPFAIVCNALSPALRSRRNLSEAESVRSARRRGTTTCRHNSED